MTKQTEQKQILYTVRKMSTSDDPADKGEALGVFNNYTKAFKHTEKLFLEDGIKSYVSLGA